MLEVRNLCKSFGGVHAMQDVSFTVRGGSVHSVIGPNGAGKTTLVNLLTGVLKPDAGKLQLFGEEVTATSAAVRTRKGLVRTFQIGRASCRERV